MYKNNNSAYSPYIERRYWHSPASAMWWMLVNLNLTFHSYIHFHWLVMRLGHCHCYCHYYCHCWCHCCHYTCHRCHLLMIFHIRHACVYASATPTAMASFPLPNNRLSSDLMPLLCIFFFSSSFCNYCALFLFQSGNSHSIFFIYLVRTQTGFFRAQSIFEIKINQICRCILKKEIIVCLRNRSMGFFFKIVRKQFFFAQSIKSQFL